MTLVLASCWIRIFLATILFGIKMGDSIGRTKSWIPSARHNFLEDCIILSQNTSTFLNKRITISKLTLSENSMILLGDAAVMEWKPTDHAEDDSCQTISHRIRTRCRCCCCRVRGQSLPNCCITAGLLRDWLDPGNWKDERDAGGFLLDSERVPCTGDLVVFPNLRTVHVLLPPAPVTLSGFNIAGQALDDETLGRFLASLFGAFQFRPRPVDVGGSGVGLPRVDPNKCRREGEECACGNDKPPVLKEICSHLKPCPRANCMDPITPFGHCCPICGGTVQFSTFPQFSFAKFRKILENFEDKNRGSSLHATRVHAGGIQVVVTQDNVVDASHLLLGYLQNGSSEYGIQDISLKISGQASSPEVSALKTEAAGGISGAGIAAIIISLLLLTLVLVLAVLVNRRFGNISQILTALTVWSAKRGEVRLSEMEVDSVRLEQRTVKAQTTYENPLFQASTLETQTSSGVLFDSDFQSVC